jgi:tetratricopeptide (TPR) repeat protein
LNTQKFYWFSVEQIQSALTLLNYPAELANHVLAKCSIVSQRMAAQKLDSQLAINEGQAVKDILVETIESFKGDLGGLQREDMPQEYKYYLILSCRYIMGEPEEKIRAQLGVSKNVYLNFHRQAIEDLGLLLQKKELEAERSSPDAESLIQVEGISHNLPQRQATFVGRDREISIALSALNPASREWEVVFSGQGGIGKTALALEIAWKCFELGYFDAIVWASAKKLVFNPITSKVEAAEASCLISTLDGFFVQIDSVLSLGLSKVSPDERRMLVIDALEKHRALLVVDDFETIEEKDDFIEFLAKLPGQCKAIVTCRWGYSGRGLTIPIEGLDNNSTFHFLRTEAITRRMDFVSELEKGELVRIRRTTDGNPLVMKWVAGQINFAKSVDKVIYKMVSTNSKDLLEFCFRNSFEMATEKGRSILLVLGFFSTQAGNDLLAAATGLKLDDIVVEEIPQLIKLALIDCTPAGFYTLNEMTRLFIVERVLQSNLSIIATNLENLVKYYCEELRLRARDDLRQYLDGEYLNIIGIIDWCEQIDVKENVPQLVVAIVIYLFDQGLWGLASQYADVGINIARSIGRNLEMVQLMCRIQCRLQMERRRLDEASSIAEEALRLSTTNEERAWALDWVGVVRREQNRLHESEEYLRKSIAIFKSLGETFQVREVEGSLTSTLRRLGKVDDALQILEKHYKEAKEANDSEEMTKALTRIGTCYIAAQRYDEARKTLLEALTLNRNMHRLPHIAYTLRRLAEVEEKAGNIGAAFNYAVESRDLFYRLRLGPYDEMVQTVTHLDELLSRDHQGLSYGK